MACRLTFSGEFPYFGRVNEGMLKSLIPTLDLMGE
jgi:hypothetical protein